MSSWTEYSRTITQEKTHVCNGKIENVGVGDGVEAGEPGDHVDDETVAHDPDQEDEDVDEEDQGREALRQRRGGERRGSEWIIC